MLHHEDRFAGARAVSRTGLNACLGQDSVQSVLVDRLLRDVLDGLRELDDRPVRGILVRTDGGLPWGRCVRLPREGAALLLLRGVGVARRFWLLWCGLVPRRRLRRLGCVLVAGRRLLWLGCVRARRWLVWGVLAGWLLLRVLAARGGLRLRRVLTAGRRLLGVLTTRRGMRCVLAARRGVRCVLAARPLLRRLLLGVWVTGLRGCLLLSLVGIAGLCRCLLLRGHVAGHRMALVWLSFVAHYAVVGDARRPLPAVPVAELVPARRVRVPAGLRLHRATLRLRAPSRLSVTKAAVRARREEERVGRQPKGWVPMLSPHLWCGEFRGSKGAVDETDGES